MYPTGGGNAYGQQPYASQHGYGQSVSNHHHRILSVLPLLFFLRFFSPNSTDRAGHVGLVHGVMPFSIETYCFPQAASGYHGTSTLSPDSLRPSAMAGGHHDVHMGGGYRGLTSSGALSGGSSAAAPTQYGAHYGTAYGAPQVLISIQ